MIVFVKKGTIGTYSSYFVRSVLPIHYNWILAWVSRMPLALNTARGSRRPSCWFWELLIELTTEGARGVLVPTGLLVPEYGSCRKSESRFCFACSVESLVDTRWHTRAGARVWARIGERTRVCAFAYVHRRISCMRARARVGARVRVCGHA